MAEEWYAKTPSKDGSQETVKSHLEKVSNLAEGYAEPIGAAELARICGILHDAGKYGTPFQNVLKNLEHRIDHAAPSAAFMKAISVRRGRAPLNKYRACIEAVNGHHGGLESYAAISDILDDICDKTSPVTNGDKRCSVPNEHGETLSTIYTRFLKDFPDFKENVLHDVAASQFMSDIQAENTVDYMLMTRMLYSCLVDGDYSASASVGDLDYLNRYTGPPLDVDSAERALDAYVDSLKATSEANPTVDAVRNELYQDCSDAGDTDDMLMTVTAPTGAGKTLALLKLALRKCRRQGLSRIIIVLPILSIADQTEQEYRRIIPGLVVDHSQCKLADDQRELAARWDAPCIITTSVKFFEALFSSNGPACRKLHNIANSVVVFDEAQTLPFNVTRPTIESIMTLCKRCRTAMVLSTATQPAFAFLNADWQPVEVVKDVHSMYGRMKRVSIDWRINGSTPLEEIASESREHEQCLVVCNLKAHALKVYEAWGENDGTYLITTALCPAHRKRILAEVKYRLDNGLPCKVAATQCIEAGVSIDFSYVYRALAPLTSIAQTAGRCNRHGKNPTGYMVVFIPGDSDETGEERRIYPDSWYQGASIVTKGLLMVNNSYVDINDPDIIREYYRRLFASLDSGESPKLLSGIKMCDYKTVEESYKIISSDGYEVIVPYDDGTGIYSKLHQDFVAGKGIVKPKLLAEVAGITVSVFTDVNMLLSMCEPVYVWNPRLNEKCFTGKYILMTGCESCYDDKRGLQMQKQSSPGLLGV